DRPAHLILDLRSGIYDYPGKVLWSRIRLRPDGTVTGFRETRGWAPGRQLYFAMRFSRPPAGHALYDREDPIDYKGFPPPADGRPEGRAQIEGRALLAVFDLDVARDPVVLLRVSVSPVSEEGAIHNLEGDAAAADFDGARSAARAAWSRALSALDVEASPAMRTSLYTALYHVLLAPNLFMDSDGRYRGPDNAVHRAQGFEFHSTFSLWDTYRAEHPLLTLVQPPRRTSDFIRSFLAFRRYSAYGLLPIWSYEGLETWCMIGYHAVSVIADAYRKGIRGFSADEALQAMVESATYGPYGDLED